MKTALMALVSTLSLALSAQASLLKLAPGSRANNGVNVSSGGTATIDGQNYALTTVGYGLRTKKVLIANIKVYVAQLLVSSPARFVHTDADALSSLEDSQTVALQMQFLRTVDAQRVQVSFRDALDANKVDVNTPAIKQLLTAVANGGDALADKALTVVINKNSDGSETLVYEDASGRQTKIKGDKNLTRSVFSIWLGVPSDDGVAALKTQLIHSQN